MKRIINKINSMSAGLKSGIVYTFSTLLTRGLAIITVPIFTRMMSSAEIGEVTLYNSWYSMLSVFATLSLTSGGYQLALKEFSDRRDQYNSSVLSITSVMALALFGIFSIAPDFWAQMLGMDKNLILLMLFGFLVAPARDFWMTRQRFEYRYKLSGSIAVLSAIFASALSIFAVLFMRERDAEKLGEVRLFANYAVVYSVAACLWLYIMLKGRTFFNKEFWSFSLKLSVPLIGHAIAKQILDVSDRQMINYYIGKDAVGIYGTLFSVSSLSLLAWGAINSSFIPYLYKNLEVKEERKKLQSTASLLLGLYTVIAVIMTMFAPEIVRILATSEYYEAIYIMPPIAAGVFFTAVSNMYSNVLVYYKKTQYIFASSAIAALCNVILNAVFIPMYGYQAAAYTTLASHILLAAVEAVLVTKVYHRVTKEKNMVYSNKAIVLMSLACVALCMSGLVLYSNVIVRYALIALLVVVACYLALKKSKRE